MRATFIGTGSFFSRRFGHTNALVEAGSTRLMIDFGYLAPSRLETCGRDQSEITHVAVSHLHADHTGGLEELAFVSKFVHRSTPTLITPHGLADLLWKYSLRGGLECVADDTGQAQRCRLADYFNIQQIGDNWEQAGDLEIRTFPTDHVPGKKSWGFVVRDPATDQRMIFGCDTRVRHPELLQDPIHPDFSSGPIFHDCQLQASGPSAIHIALTEIEYPAEVMDRLVLVHYGDNLEDLLETIHGLGLEIARPGQTIDSADW
jgi:L-ascorbate metabolism protein UlaG (beta-lactamase superfamily)